MTDESIMYLRQVMSSEDGRRFIYEILQSTGIDNRSGPAETMYANYIAGKRFIGEMLRDSITELPGENDVDGLVLYSQMIREARLREQLEEQKKQETMEDVYNI